MSVLYHIFAGEFLVYSIDGSTLFEDIKFIFRIQNVGKFMFKVSCMFLASSLSYLKWSIEDLYSSNEDEGINSSDSSEMM